MKKLLILIFALSFCGCVNVTKHIPLHQTTSLYQPTSFVVCDCVGIWWNREYRKKYPIESSWIELTWLIWVVDLPCEAVADTLTLPLDIPQMIRYNENQRKKNKNGRFGLFEEKNETEKQYILNCDYEINIGD